MSVKLGLMALLADGEKYGAQLRAEFEERTGGTWPLNVGQVYTTVDRLMRDGLVEQAGDPDPEGRISYRLTEIGRAEVDRWWTTPVDRDNTPRDELTIKLALAVTVPGVDVQQVAQFQRTATLRHLRDLTRLKHDVMTRDAQAGDARSRDLAWLLVLDRLIFDAEAEARWLDHVEARLLRASAAQSTTSPRSPAAGGTDRAEQGTAR